MHIGDQQALKVPSHDKNKHAAGTAMKFLLRASLVMGMKFRNEAAYKLTFHRHANKIR